MEQKTEVVKKEAVEQSDPVIEKAKQEEKMKREHFTEGLAFADALKTKLGCEVKKIKGRGGVDDLLILFKGKKIAYISPRAGVWFGGYRLWKQVKPFRIESQEHLDVLYQSFSDHIKELVSKPKPIKKSRGRQHTSEVIANLEKRIKKLPKDAKGIELQKGVLTKEVRNWAKKQGYSVSGNQIILNRD